MAGRLDAVEPLLAVAERALERTPAAPYRASLDRRFSVLANIPAGIAVCRADLARMRGDAEAEQAFARAALAHVTEQDELLGSVARYQVAFGDLLAGRVAAAERGLAGVFAERVASAQHDLVPRAAFDLGAVQLARGHLRAAQRTYEQGLAGHGGRSTVAVGGHVARRAGRGALRTRRARRRAPAGRRRASSTAAARVPPGPDRGPDRARAAPAAPQGDLAGALAAVDEADRAMPQAVLDPRLPVPALRAHLAVANGDVAEAARWVRSAGLSVDDEPVYLREREYRVLARVLIAEHDPGGGARGAGALAGARASPGTHGERAAAAAAGGAGAQRRGRPHRGAAGPRRGARARRAGGLRARVPRRGRGRSRRCCASWRWAVASNSSARGRSPASFLAGLTDAFDRHGTGVRPPRRGSVAAPGPARPLSTREHEVLTLMASGHPNRAIAEKLFITVDTVKRHVTHVFEKLGVANRTQAVARARDLGLLG